MSIFDNLFKKREELELKKEIPLTENEDEITAVIAAVVASMDEEEIVAAITASIACMLGKSTNEFIVRNIKRTSYVDSLWALKGRMKLMR